MKYPSKFMVVALIILKILDSNKN